jgi:outer membrane protein OmpA-like peptidoglycan-associated protein
MVYDAKDWANSLKKYLKSTYKIDSKLLTRGLGNARLIIGEK